MFWRACSLNFDHNGVAIKPGDTVFTRTGDNSRSGRREAVSGLLRVSAPGALGRQWIAPIMADFQQLHPQLTVQLELTDVVVDLLDSGLDMAVRFGSLSDSSMIARPLAPNYRGCARLRLTSKDMGRLSSLMT